MSTETYLLYLLVSSLTISSPGPGVVFSLTNAINKGFAYAVPGFIGLALGTLVMSVVAVSGIGTLVATHEYAFTVLRYVGAVYLVYLGIKLWRNTGVANCHSQAVEKVTSAHVLFRQGVLITLLNPKLMVFFLALFPQFIDPEKAFISQFSILALTFCGLLMFVHIIYCLFAAKISRWLTSPGGFSIFNRVSGGIFFCFAIGLVIAK